MNEWTFINILAVVGAATLIVRLVNWFADLVLPQDNPHQRV